MNNDRLTDEQRDELLANRPQVTVTKESIAEKVKSVEYFRPENSTLTIAVVTLENGYQVTGESACAHPDNFDEKLGQKIAYDNAINKVWPLEGYLLKEALHLNGGGTGDDESGEDEQEQKQAA